MRRNEKNFERCIEYAKCRVTDLIWHTACIEIPGIKLDEVRRICQDDAVWDGDRRALMVVDNVRLAWKFLLGEAEWPANVQYAQEYDRLIGTDVEIQPGRIRTMPVTISGTRYVPPIPTLGTVLAAFDEANALEDSVTGALLLFDRCCREQWFANGNKRTACMLANHVLIHAGAGVLTIPPALVESEFKDCLIEYYDSGDSAELDRWLVENALVRLPIMR